MCAKIKKEEKHAVVHKELVTRQDLHKLYTFLNLETAKGIQNKGLVDSMLYFCNRGRENLRELKISDFSKGTDDEGIRYIYVKRLCHKKS